MANGRKREQHLRPIQNLQEYVKNKNLHMAAGWVGGKIHLNGKYYTEQEFEKQFPCELIYNSIQIDGTQIKSNN